MTGDKVSKTRFHFRFSPKKKSYPCCEYQGRLGKQHNNAP